MRTSLRMHEDMWDIISLPPSLAWDTHVAYAYTSISNLAGYPCPTFGNNEIQLNSSIGELLWSHDVLLIQICFRPLPTRATRWKYIQKVVCWCHR